MSLPYAHQKRSSLVRWARIVTYSLLLIWACEYFLIQPALLTVDQLPDPEPGLALLSKRLMDHTAFLASPELQGRAPGTPGNTIAEKYLLDQFTGIGLISPSPTGQKTQTITPTIGNNVFSALPQMKPDRPWILLGAHFDHIGKQDDKVYPGADDNASSVAVMLETARLLKNDENLKRFNLLFIGFNAEEPPYILTKWMGSQHFYSHIEEIGIDPKQIRLAIILDILGGIFWKPLQDTIFIMGSEKSPKLEALIPDVAVQGLKVHPLGISMIENIPGVGQHIVSDYQVFRVNSVPYLFLSSGRTPQYHRHTDSADRLNYTRMARTVMWLKKLVQKIDRLDTHWTYQKNRQNLKLDLQTLAPLITQAAQWKTRIPQTGPISLFKLKKDLTRIKTIAEKVRERRILTGKDALALELASTRIQCLLGKMGPCFLMVSE